MVGSPAAGIFSAERGAFAAHTGDGGLRFWFADAGASPTFFLDEYVSGTGTFYLRALMRVGFEVPPGMQASPVIVHGTAIGNLAEFQLNQQGQGWATLTSSTKPFGALFRGKPDAGTAYLGSTWHCLEYQLTGVGSADASLAGALDGVIFDTLYPDWSGVTVKSVRVGSSAFGVSAAGTLDVDELVFAKSALPSQLHLRVVPAADGCQTIEVSVAATFDGGTFPTPIAVAASVISGTGLQCGDVGPGATLDTFGQFAPVASLRTMSDLVTVEVSAPGLLSKRVQLACADARSCGDAGEIESDAGSAEPKNLRLGCGCGTGEPAALALALAISAGWYRRRGRRGER